VSRSASRRRNQEEGVDFFTGYGQPSRFEAGVARVFVDPPNAPGSGAARAPPHRLQGMITPNGLHFERSHSGVPDIDPDTHRLLIHGLVARPLVFSLESKWSRKSHSSKAAAIARSSIRPKRWTPNRAAIGRDRPARRQGQLVSVGVPSLGQRRLRRRAHARADRPR
jgi:hypothetical protein